MKNITLAVDDDILAQARAFARKNGTTVNALVRDYLRDLLLQEERIKEAKRGLKKLMDNSTGRLGPDYKWDREAIYEERLFPRHEHPDLRGGRKT